MATPRFSTIVFVWTNLLARIIKPDRIGNLYCNMVIVLKSFKLLIQKAYRITLCMQVPEITGQSLDATAEALWFSSSANTRSLWLVWLTTHQAALMSLSFLLCSVLSQSQMKSQSQMLNCERKSLNHHMFPILLETGQILFLTSTLSMMLFSSFPSLPPILSPFPNQPWCWAPEQVMDVWLKTPMITFWRGTMTFFSEDIFPLSIIASACMFCDLWNK